MRTTEELLRPPTEEQVARGLARFSKVVRAHYGQRLKGLYLFGSRARGDHHPHSDVDVAVILDDGDWRSWDEVRALSDLTYDILIEDGPDIQGVPIRLSEWEEPSRHSNPSLVRTARRDGKPLEEHP
ncbi:MAG: putative polymerase, beta domain protein region [Microvirga sp.]|jgi:antitoxin ChpS|nr:putative polymerase, beta domain protein region [Microvirga sp.]